MEVFLLILNYDEKVNNHEDFYQSSIPILSSSSSPPTEKKKEQKGLKYSLSWLKVVHVDGVCLCMSLHESKGNKKRGDC